MTMAHIHAGDAKSAGDVVAVIVPVGGMVTVSCAAHLLLHGRMLWTTGMLPPSCGLLLCSTSPSLLPGVGGIPKSPIGFLMPRTPLPAGCWPPRAGPP